MPRWATPIGCLKLILALTVFGLLVACAAIWDSGSSNLAIIFSLFTVSAPLMEQPDLSQFENTNSIRMRALFDDPL